MLAAARDEERVRTPQGELARSAVGAGDDYAAAVLAKLDDRDRLGLPAEMPYPGGCTDGGKRSRGLHYSG